MNKILIISYILVFVLFFTIMQARGQALIVPPSGKSIELGISGGISTPFGNYAKTDFSDPKSGFLGSGYNFGINGRWFFKKHWGVCAQVAYTGYRFNGLQSIADGFHEAYAIDSSTVTAIGTNYSVSVLAGLCYELPLSSKVWVRAKLMAGFANAHLAGYQVAIEDQSAATFSQNEASASCFAAYMGISAGHKVAKRLRSCQEITCSNIGFIL